MCWVARIGSKKSIKYFSINKYIFLYTAGLEYVEFFEISILSPVPSTSSYAAVSYHTSLTASV